MNKYSQSFSRRTILVIGRRLTPLDVRTWTERTSPSSLVLTLSTTPSGQFPREVDSSTIITSSFGLRLEDVLVHFDRHCRAGRYSRSQRFQNTSERYCTCRHHRLVSVSRSSKIPGGRLVWLWRPVRSMDGVSGGEFGSSLEVIGRSFMIRSASHMKDKRLSSVRRC